MSELSVMIQLTFDTLNVLVQSWPTFKFLALTSESWISSTAISSTLWAWKGPKTS